MPENRSSFSPVLIVVGILGGVFLLVMLGCGALGLFVYLRVQAVTKEAHASFEQVAAQVEQDRLNAANAAEKGSLKDDYNTLKKN